MSYDNIISSRIVVMTEEESGPVIETCCSNEDNVFIIENVVSDDGLDNMTHALHEHTLPKALSHSS